MSFYAIGNSLNTILTTVKNATGSRLQEVYNYDAPDTGTGYPYATIGTPEAEENVLDTATNETVYKFTIRSVDVNKDKANMEQTMRRLADDILTELRKAANQTFGGTVDRVFPFTVKFSWGMEGNVPSRICEIQVEVSKEFTI